MRDVRKHRRSRRRGNDRGAALIELAMVLPLLLLLVFGVVEFGFAWTEVTNLETSVGSAARTGASQGAGAYADYNTLATLQSSLSSEGLAQLQQVVIFNATSLPTGQVPTACTGIAGNGGIANTCNVYTGATVRSLAKASFGSGTSTGCSTGLDQYWCPTTRNSKLSQPPDYIGVYVKTFHKNQTHSYWGDFTITKTAVYRLEPPA